jgi:hypothetical protein
MVRRALCACLFLASIGISFAQQSTSPMSDFVGRWVVTDVVGYGDVSGGMPEAKRLIGKVLVISNTGIDFDRQNCKPTKGLRVVEVETGPVLEKYYGITTADAGLPAKTMLLDSDACVPVFRLDEQRIVLGWNGVVVRAVKDDSVARPMKRPDR